MDRPAIEGAVDIAFRDVGSLRLFPDALEDVLVDRLQRLRGWQGKTTQQDEHDRIARTVKDHDAARQVVAWWQSEANDQMGDWLEVLFIGELTARLLSPDDFLDWLEQQVGDGRYEIFAAPTVGQHWRRARADNTPEGRSRRPQILRIKKALARITPGRMRGPSKDLEERADVQVFRRRQRGESVEDIAADRRQDVETIQTYINRGRDRVEGAGNAPTGNTRT